MRKKGSLILSLAIIFSVLLTSISYADVTTTYVNPLMGGADPTIARAADGYYYSCSSGDNNITLKRHETILGASTSKSKIVWKKEVGFGYVWGPYIYRLDGKWYIYFASAPENDFGYGHPSSYVLENPSPDPFQGTWVLKGVSSNKNADGTVTAKQGLLNTEGYGLACGVIMIKGERYFTYTKYFYTPTADPTKTKFDECITIVKMTNPWTLVGEECTLARPEYNWEKSGDNINEGAAVVERDGKVYFSYSASSFMNDNYCVGVSVADLSSDIMDPKSWTKFSEPGLKRSDENSSYGPGSPLFLKSEDGTEDLIVYHGIPTHGQGGGNRGIRVQPINWGDNDVMNLGIPSNPGTVLLKPSGSEKSEIYEAEDAKLLGASKVLAQSAYSSGAQYVKYNNSSDEDYIEFTVNTNSGGIYALDIRYNNNTVDAINMKLGVNQDATRNISFASNVGFAANFDVKTVNNVTLRAGSNTIRLYGKSTLALDAMIIKRSTLYEAEDAVRLGNAKVDKDHTGFSGTGFIGGLWQSDSGITFTVNADNASNYSVKLRYCLGFNDYDRNLSMYVNGKKIKQVEFFHLNGWDNWADRYDNVFLKEGANTITYKFDGGDSGNVNLDYITATEATTWTYEAENAKTYGLKDAKVIQAKDGNTGAGYINGLSRANSSVEYSVNIENAASYDVKLRYSNENAGKTLALYLNGTLFKNIILPITGGHTVWKEQIETLNLKEGKNTFTYKCETDNSGIINIDNIHISKRTPWKYQAEYASRSENLKVMQDHLWYEGNGFVGGFKESGDSIQFEVNVPNTTSYTTTLRYSGVQKSNITMTMYVNEEKIKQVSILPTANWDTWTDATETVNLKAGKNVIEFIRDYDDTGVLNIDSLTIDKFSGGFMSSIAKSIIPEKLVKIQPKHSGKALDVDALSSNAKAVINQWANGDGNNQLWRFKDLGTGYYQIESSHSGRIIDILPGSTIGQICQNAKYDEKSITDTNQWKLEKVGDYYKIINKSNGKVITVEESTNNGAKVMVADDTGKDNQLMKIQIRNLSDSEFYAVTDITNVPTTVKVGEESLLLGSISPDYATRKSIAWSVKDDGTTGATIHGNMISATNSGTAVLTATIAEGSAVGAEYTKDITITVITDNAEISPESASFDINAPADVSTTIIWNKASAVTGMVYGVDNVTTSSAITVTTQGALAIKSDYLAGLGLANGNKAEFTFSFDMGNPVAFTVNIIDSSIEVPAKLTATAAGISSINIDWTPVTGATGYKLYRAIAEDGTYSKLADITTESAIYVDTNLQANTTYYYKVTTVTDAGESIMSAAAYATTEALEIPTGLTAKAAGTSSIDLAWLAVTGATGYNVFRSTAEAGAYNKVANITTESAIYVDTNLQANTTYYYKVTTVTSAGESAKSAVASATTAKVVSETPTQPIPPTPSPVVPVVPTVPTPTTSNNGTSVTITTTTEAKSDINGNATATVTERQITEAVTKAVAEAAKNAPGTDAIVEIKVSAAADAKSVEIGIPAASISALSDNKIDAIIITSPIATMTFDYKALSTISNETDADVKITASKVDVSTLSEEVKQSIGDRPVFTLSVTSAGKTISEFGGGNATVVVPYTLKSGEDKNAIVIYYINAAGKAEIVKNCTYDIATGKITFKTTHFSQYAVGYNKVDFSDVAANKWYSNAVSYVAARGITAGTGDNKFSPADKLTRGQFLVMVMKAYGQKPDENAIDNFTDAGNTYYTGYLAAAKRLGITAGIGDNKYAPKNQITRQEMFTLLYNTLKLIGQLPTGNNGKAVTDFADAGDIAPWAKDAMTVFVNAEIIAGSDNKLTPVATTNRAQMAQVLYNLLSK